MKDDMTTISLEPQELEEWLDSLDYILARDGERGAAKLLGRLQEHLHRRGARHLPSVVTPYVNTIPVDREPRYPGSRELERRIKCLVRWNAMAMVVRANRESSGIGGHISTYASAATLFEVGFNHFFHGRDGDQTGDQVYLQGHAAPGVYARAFLEGRLTVEQLENFRREAGGRNGLPSYPHPWLMPGFWEFPTVSMGLAPLMAIYQARFNRYLKDRGIRDTSGCHVWCLLGDGECDEPESLGSLSVAAREGLDNLTFVVNCNLQRLDGPVRGNGKIIQELEAVFRGAGWNVIKVIWGSDWDPLLAADEDGWLVRRMEECVDGDYQKYSVEDGKFTRGHFFGKYPALRQMAEDLSDEQIRRLRRGGHDPQKLFAAYQAAIDHQGAPTVILAKTIKGYGLGEAGEGRNVTHQQKKLSEEELAEFRSRFGIPIGDDEVAKAPFYKPADDSQEIQYLQKRRKELGGYVPQRVVDCEPIDSPELDAFSEFLQGTGDRPASTMMAFARLLSKLLKHETVGELIVPIIPDEARTFGLDALFRQAGIYSSQGQQYEPVDRETLLYYREAKDGQILEEGITEAGSMASFIAAGTADVTHGVPTIPFFIYYSMFGFQRVGDLIWAASDMRTRGFLMGGTAGRTSLAGEGLQHQDGHSQLVMGVVPTVRAYDPAFAYELAVIIQEGMRRMYGEREDAIYYITIYNEPYPQPEIPDGAADGILKGLYLYRRSEKGRDTTGSVHLFGSGPVLREALRAAEILEHEYGVAADVWSVTSYNQLYRDCQHVERWNLLHPTDEPRSAHLVDSLLDDQRPVIAATDYVKAVPELVSKWIPGGMTTLGTDGFGRSDDRAALRRHFEVSAEHIAVAALHALAQDETIEPEMAAKAVEDLSIDADARDPLYA
jgi:pyruvate dehydrogenase E1 component